MNAARSDIAAALERLRMRYLAIAAVLLLAGCLEAADLVEEQIVSPAYCETPRGVALCSATEAGSSRKAAR